MTDRRTELEALSRELADLIQGHLAARGLPRDTTGFGLYLFSHGPDKMMAWISNCEREGMIASLREWIARQEGTWRGTPGEN